IAAYSHLLDTIGMPESEYSAFLQYKETKDKHDYLSTFGVDNDEDIAKTLAMFGGFTEGLQLFASFAMLMNFPRFNKMTGMGQIGFAPISMVDEHPLPWLAPLLNGVEHANFFETRATEYSKAATRGNWGEVWDNFDRRQKAKADAANDGPAEASGDGDPDMFSAAGVAAE